MNSFSIQKIARSLAIFTITLFVLGSCEKKENTIGSGFLNGEKFDGGIYRKTKLLTFTTQKELIKTSGASLNLLGVYQDPIFGNIKSSFAIQAALSKEGPDFGTNPIIDSVILTMPYLGRADSDSTVTFNTDSIYGNKNLEMNIKISRLISFLHPDSTYYSDISFPIGDEIYNEIHVFNPDSISLSYRDTTDTGLDTIIHYKVPPSFRLKLINKFFQDNIVDTDPINLATNGNFIKHINGFVFETESTDGAIYSLNMLKKTGIVLYYHNDESYIRDGKVFKSERYDLVFSSKLARVNKYDFDRDMADPSLVAQLKDDYDTIPGSDFIFMQGMSGIQADIKLFTDDIQLDTLRKEKWIVNRADLVFRVSDDNKSDVGPPFRLMMVNRDSISVPGADYRMIDYVIEPFAFNGYLKSDATILSNSEDRYYRFRITNYVSAILDGELKLDENGQPIKDKDGNFEVIYDDNTNYPLRLISFSGNESVSRVKLNGSNNSDSSKNIFLEIQYSKKEF